MTMASKTQARAKRAEALSTERKKSVEFLLEQIEGFKQALTMADAEMSRLQELLGKAHGYAEPVILARAPAFDLGISRIGAFVVCHTCGGGIYKYENITALYCPFCERPLNRPEEMRMKPPFPGDAPAPAPEDEETATEAAE